MCCYDYHIETETRLGINDTHIRGFGRILVPLVPCALWSRDLLGAR